MCANIQRDGDDEGGGDDGSEEEAKVEVMAADDVREEDRAQGEAEESVSSGTVHLLIVNDNTRITLNSFHDVEGKFTCIDNT